MIRALNAPFRFDSAARSHIGCLRRANEDSFLSQPERGLWLVADGMGGHAAGDVASATIASEAASMGLPVSPLDQRMRLREKLDRAHLRIVAHADQHGFEVVGSTVAALLVHDRQRTCIWAGDSRVYLHRCGALMRLTRDHSEVAALIAAGLLDEDSARAVPRRHVITRAIGIGTLSDPDIATGEVQAGDTFLLCTDGLTEHLTDAEIEALLAPPLPAAALADALIAATLGRGAFDNVTVIVVRCLPAEARTGAPR